MGREIKYGLLAVLFLIVLAAVVWDRFNLKRRIPFTKKNLPSAKAAHEEEENLMEFLIGGDAPKIRPGRGKGLSPGSGSRTTQPTRVQEDPASRSPGGRPSSGEGRTEGPASFVKHTVAPGESLAKIAKKYYGRESQWKRLQDFNRIADPQKLQIGQVVVIPRSETDSPHPPPPDPAETVHPAVRTYVVKKGDNLYRIARDQLGDAERWRELAARNGIDDPKKLKTGARLTLR